MSKTVLPAGAGPVDGQVRPACRDTMENRLRACAEDPMWADHAEVPKKLCADAADQLKALEAMADSEGTRAVQYLRRARKAEKLLREVLDTLPGLQAPNCLGMDLYQRISTALGPNC